MLDILNPKWVCIALLRLYQWAASPLKRVLFGTAGCCRFWPTCSSYAIEALRAHGFVAGGWLTAKRLLRCQPWGGEGHDPVPERAK